MEKSSTTSIPLRDYWALTKPGILFGNAVTAAGGFAVASKVSFSPYLFFCTIFGLLLVIASACVCNNCIDRDLDQKMARTHHRPLAKGTMPLLHATVFAGLLGALGIGILATCVHMLATLATVGGFIIYVCIYSFVKYRTHHATLIGSFAGATAPLVGYCAVANEIDMGGILLFLLVLLWQMPHFFAIALFRMNDYKIADIPVFPLQKGIVATKHSIVLYILAFNFVAYLVYLYGYTGNNFLITSFVLGGSWLLLSLRGLRCDEDALWARQMFLCSLVVIMGVCGICFCST